MTSRPTMMLPAIEPATPPPAWADLATRRAVRRQLWAALAFLGLAAIGITATVILAAPDVLDQPWGLPALTAAGGLAGGALAGGITQVVLGIRVRGFLRAGPWFAGEMTLGNGRYAWLSRGPHSIAVRLDVPTAKLGVPGDRLAVEVRSDGGPHLVTVPPSRRLIRAVTKSDTDAQAIREGALDRQ